MKQKLWTRNFTLITLATVFGAAGGIAGGFALSFFVYDETGSTLAAALLSAVQILPSFLIPLVASPAMDRRPRKPFLVAGDAVNAVLYGLAGLWLLRNGFSYGIFVLFSLLLSSLGVFDMLAYNSFYPTLIPQGCEERGYTVSAMVYPVLQVVMSPIAAWLLDTIGVAKILLIQAGFSLLAAIVESFIDAPETHVKAGQEPFSFKQWWGDLRAAVAYLKKEKGLQSIYTYISVTNGVGSSLPNTLVAFFRSTPGYTTAMYSLFTVAEFAGRSLGGLLRYVYSIPPKKRYRFIFFVYQFYDSMDAMLLWLPYPLMLVNRAVCGFLGMNSGTMRYTAVQSYIPDEFRARINAFESVLLSASASAFSLLMGALGELLPYRWVLTAGGCLCLLVSWLTILRDKEHVSPVYGYVPPVPEKAE